jgi:hypothetical protein
MTRAGPDVPPADHCPDLRSRPWRHDETIVSLGATAACDIGEVEFGSAGADIQRPNGQAIVVSELRGGVESTHPRPAVLRSDAREPWISLATIPPTPPNPRWYS